jgi:hypothetical protein
MSSDTAPGTPWRARRPKRKPLNPEAIASIAELQQLSEQSRLDYGKAPSTRGTYNGYLQAGNKFLAKTVAERRRCQDSEKDGINTDLLAKAFDNPPNVYSETALEFFLVEKCIREGCKRSTAEGIQAAFADHWDHMWVALQFVVVGSI